MSGHSLHYSSNVSLFTRTGSTQTSRSIPWSSSVKGENEQSGKALHMHFSGRGHWRSLAHGRLHAQPHSPWTHFPDLQVGVHSARLKKAPVVKPTRNASLFSSHSGVVVVEANGVYMPGGTAILDP